MEFINDDNFFSKLELVLSKLITPELRIPDDTVFQKLFDSISNVFLVEECQEKLIKSFVPWISSVTIKWKDIHINTRVFALQLVSLVCQNESGFFTMKKNNSMSEVFSYFRSDGEAQFSLTLAYIDVLSSCIKHSAGIKWIFETGIHKYFHQSIYNIIVNHCHCCYFIGSWKDVLRISLSNKSLYALRKSRNLIAEIMVSQMNDNISICQEIVDRAFYLCCKSVNGIHNNGSNILKCIHNQKEFIPDNLTSLNPVMLLREVFLHLLDKNVSSETLSIIGWDKVKDWAWKNIEETENPLILSNISKLLCVLNIIYIPHVMAGKMNYSDMRIANQHVIDHCSILIQKKEFEHVQEACVEYLMLWNRLRINKEIIYDIEESTTYSFESTPFTILSIPLHIFLQVETVMESDVLGNFADKVSTISCAQTKQACSLYEEHFCKHSGTKIQTLAVSVIQSYIRIASIIRKAHGVIVFQILFHIIKKIIPNEYVGFEFAAPAGYSCAVEQFPEYLILLSSALEALLYYIPPCDLSWRNYFETSCILDLVLGIFEMPSLLPRMYVDALKVTNVILNGYLQVTFTLPLDKPIGCSMDKLCGQIFKLLHSVQWEIRDSALELLQAICALTEYKMQALQTLLLKYDFPDLLISILQSDPEPYVRASVLTCLRHMVRLNLVWDSALQHQFLMDKVYNILMHDQEGIVRHNAVLFIEALYNHINLSQEDLDKMLNLLCNVTLRDLHWEVKKASIQFWDTVLKKNLLDVGMNCGDFDTPTVLQGKIIKMTPKEKSLRISKVFDKLSACGCLYVLWEVIQHDCDLEVTKEAGKLILKMITLAQKFDALAPFNDVETLSCTSKTEDVDKIIKQQSLGVTKNQKISTDEVIESIVSEGDLNLLAGLLKTDNSSSMTLLLESREKLEVQQFFTNVLKFDVNKSEMERVEWISKTSDGIISLFDDILLSNQYQSSKTNVIDCY